MHSKPLYAAIGEPNNRNRKPVTLARAIERLMVLDTVLARAQASVAGQPSARRSSTSSTATTLRLKELPHLVFGAGPEKTIRYFPDKLPIGIAGDGRTHVFLYLVNRQTPVDFRAFLHRHAELLRALAEWELRLLVPRHLVEAAPLFEAGCREMSWAGRFAWTTWPNCAGTSGSRTKSIDGGAPEDFRRFRRACRAFSGAAVSRALSALEEERRPALDATVSPVLEDKIARRRGHVTSEVLVPCLCPSFTPGWLGVTSEIAANGGGNDRLGRSVPPPGASARRVSGARHERGCETGDCSASCCG